MCLPTDAVLAVTYNCNSRCRMCNIWKTKGPSFLELDEYKKLPRTLRDINLSGGEPFLRDNLPQIIKILVNQNPKARIIISSNGFATDLIRTQMGRILQIDPEVGVALSLDGIGQAHEEVRGIPGAYDKVMATLIMLKELGVRNLRLAFTAGDYNIGELNKVYDLSRKLGIEFTVAAVHNSTNYFKTSDMLITYLDKFKKEFGLLIEKELATGSPKRWLRAYFAWALWQFVRTGKRVLPNYAGKKSFFLDPLGEVYPADVSVHKMGNLKNFKSFKLLYKNKKAKEAIKKEKAAQHWMICTARMAMRRHFLRVGFWILKAKLFGVRLK